MNPQSFPLTWPQTEIRTPYHRRERARWGTQGRSHGGYGRRPLTIAEAIDRLMLEIERLGATQSTISSDIPLRNDGRPRGSARDPDDPGVFVYLTVGKLPYCLPSDSWDRVADNIAAIAAHIGAMRGMKRWGVGSIEKNFAGYLALPAPVALRPWYDVLGLSENADIDLVYSRYKELALEFHPDNGGNHEDMAELNRAIAEARVR